MRKPTSVAALSEFGRRRLSRHFFMRDFLFSDIAAIHGLTNVPDDPELATIAGERLCQDLLEPLQATFGRIAIRSGYRSAEVNGFGNHTQRTTNKLGYTCSSNAANAAAHIWDLRDGDGCMGAMACIVLPEFWDRFPQPGDWRKLAWWVHDHLPYATLEFYPTFWAFNIGWHERPMRTIYSYAEPKGFLTRPGDANHGGQHESAWRDILG